MSVLIKGMEMPKSCYECRFSVNSMCIANRGRKDVGITNSCPLVAVPDHGDLIDRDMVLEKAWDIETFFDAVRFAPTIIPADKEDEI